MKRSGFFALFFIISCLALAQQQGIKLLVRDRETGTTLRDSLRFTINDSLKIEAVADANGHFFFSLPVGIYKIKAGRVEYQASVVSGITVGISKTAYVTLNISKPDPVRKRTKKKKRKKK